MAKTGRAVAKLVEKDKRRAIGVALGTQRAVITRTRSSYHDKREAFEVHKRLIHGFRHGNFVNEGGVNPCPPVTYDAKGQHIVTFRGDGLPDDSLVAIKPAKTMAERAAEDKRRPLKDEMIEGWMPARYEPRFMRFARRFGLPG